MNFMKLTWSDIDDHIDFLAKNMSDYHPDMLISIGRGGMIPTRLLSDCLGVHTIGYISVKLYSCIGKKGLVPKFDRFDISVQDKKILLVDDIIDSGLTMLHVYNTLKSGKYGECKQLRLAALLTKNQENFLTIPSYSSSLIPADTWVVFPWEKKETQKEIGEINDGTVKTA